jgi:hypothetical protein
MSKSMKEGSVIMPNAFGMVIVASLMTVMFNGHGWVWVPVLLAVLLGGAVAKTIGG